MENRRVFILGAGISHELTLHAKLPIPLANQFFEQRYIDGFWRSHFGFETPFEASALGKVLNDYFPASFPHSEKKSPLNIEDVYSFLDSAASTFVSKRSMKRMFDSAKEQLHDYMGVVVYHCTREVNASFYHALLPKLDAGDSIISFNWDSSLDRAMTKSATGREYLKCWEHLFNPTAYASTIPQSNDETIYDYLTYFAYLRLHGSLSYSVCPDQTCPRSRVPYEESSSAWPDIYYCIECGTGLVPFIIPPNIKKSYVINRLYRLQANIAHEILTDATEIIIIGYSFPVADFEASTLFRMSRQVGTNIQYDSLHRIVLVNPSVREPDYINRVRDIFGLNERAGREAELVTYESLSAYTSAEMQRLTEL